MPELIDPNQAVEAWTGDEPAPRGPARAPVADRGDPNSAVEAWLKPTGDMSEFPTYRMPQENRLQRSQRLLGEASEYWKKHGDDAFGRYSSDYWASRIPGANVAHAVDYYKKLYDATQRIENDQWREEDWDTLAKHQAREEYFKKRGIADTAIDAATAVPGMAAEFALTGPLGAGGRLAARKAAERILGKYATTRLGAAAVGTAGFAGSAFTQTAASPSMWTESAMAENVAQGRAPLDQQGVTRSLARGTAMMAGLQAAAPLTHGLFQGGGILNAAGRVGTQAVVGGAVVSPILEVATGLLDKASGLDTGYGTIQLLMEGKKGEAAKRIVEHMATWAAFGLTHEVTHRGPRTMEEFAEKVKEEARKGVPVQEAVFRAAKDIPKESPIDMYQGADGTWKVREPAKQLEDRGAPPGERRGWDDASQGATEAPKPPSGGGGGGERLALEDRRLVAEGPAERTAAEPVEPPQAEQAAQPAPEKPTERHPLTAGFEGMEYGEMHKAAKDFGIEVGPKSLKKDTTEARAALLEQINAKLLEKDAAQRGKVIAPEVVPEPPVEHSERPVEQPVAEQRTEGIDTPEQSGQALAQAIGNTERKLTAAERLRMGGKRDANAPAPPKMPEKVVPQETPSDRLTPEEREVADAFAKLADQGDMSLLNDRQRHIVTERRKGRSLDQIAQDDVMRKRDGTPYTRERIRQIESEAQTILGKSKSIDKGELAEERAGRSLDAMARGEASSYTELHSDPSEARRKIKERRTKREAELEEQANKLLREAELATRRGLKRDRVEEAVRTGEAEGGTGEGDRKPQDVRAGSGGGGAEAKPAPRKPASERAVKAAASRKVNRDVDEAAKSEVVDKAVAEGIPADLLHTRAREVKQTQDESNRAHNAVYDRAFTSLVKRLQHQFGLNKRSAENRARKQIRESIVGDATKIHQYDEIAAELSNELMDVGVVHEGLGGKAQEAMRRILSEGRRESSELDAYNEAYESLRSEKESADADRLRRVEAGEEGDMSLETGEGYKPDEVEPGVYFAGLPPHMAKNAWEWATSNRVAGHEPPIKVDYTSRVPALQDQGELKLIATSPRGIAKAGRIGKMLDPRAREQTPASEAIITRQYTIELGKNLAEMQVLKWHKYKDLFHVDEASGTIGLRDGTRGYLSDVIEAEMRMPGTQKITPEERAFIRDEWTPYLRELVEKRRAEGLSTFLTEDGRLMPIEDVLKRGYFPRQAIGKRTVDTDKTDPISVGKMRPGAKQSSERSRKYKTEREGAEGDQQVIYDPDFLSRVGKVTSDHYRAIADHRLANDRALGGVEPFELQQIMIAERGAELDALKSTDYDAYVDVMREIRDKAHSGKIWGVWHPINAGPAFDGKLFPVETAKAIEKAYGEGTSQAVNAIRAATDLSKGAVLTGDMSAPFVQGLPLLFDSPRAWLKATAASYRSLLDPEMLPRILSVPENAQAMTEFVQGGGSLGHVDFLRGTQKGELLTRIPVAGKFFESAGRAYRVFLDVGKLELWKAYREVTPKEKWADTIEMIENQLGIGRMESRGLSQGAAVAERLTLLAPSFYRGNADLVARALFTGGVNGNRARMILGKFMAGTVLTAVGGMLAVGLDWDDIGERLNPANGKFLKVPVKMGDKTIEVGFSHVILSSARLIGDMAEQRASQNPIDTGAEGNPLIRWLRGKSAFLPRLAADAYTGTDFTGKRQTLTEAVARSFEPIVVQNIIHGDGSPTQDVGAAVAGFLGASAYPQSESSAYFDTLNKTAKGKFGKPYSAISIMQQAEVIRDVGDKAPKTEMTPEMAKRVEAKREERQERLMSGLPKEQREVLGQFGKKLPAYQASIEVKGHRVPLSKPQIQEYEKALIEEYGAEIRKWKPADMKIAKKERLESWMNDRLSVARERAKKRLMSYGAN